MSMLERVKAMPLPEPTETMKLVGGQWVHVLTGSLFNEDKLRAAREQVAAEADERIERLAREFERAIGTCFHERAWHDVLSNPSHFVNVALAEARKA